jgi:hypothetical protein
MVSKLITFCSPDADTIEHWHKTMDRAEYLKARSDYVRKMNALADALGQSQVTMFIAQQPASASSTSRARRRRKNEGPDRDS